MNQTHTGEVNIDDASIELICVVVPAKNEADSIEVLINSFDQRSNAHIEMVVVDNNSTDDTALKAARAGAQVIRCAERGVGSARKAGLEYVLGNLILDRPEHTLIVQTDADCIADNGYLEAIEKTFEAETCCKVSVGPSVYEVPMEDGSLVELASGREYGAFLGTVGLRGYFEKFGRRPQEYMLGDSWRYLVGPNTVFRASLFDEHALTYPTDGRWETLDLSVALHQAVTSESILHIPGQVMQVSSRAIVGPDNSYLTAERLANIRLNGYVGVYKKEGVSMSPFETIAKIIAENDRRTYGLSDQEAVRRIIRATDAVQGGCLLPLRHAVTRAVIPGYYAELS